MDAYHTIRTYTETGPLGAYAQPVDRLKLLHELAGEVQDAIYGEVAAARANGSTWQDIGAALRVTRQAAQDRFGRVRVGG